LCYVTFHSSTLSNGHHLDYHYIQPKAEQRIHLHISRHLTEQQTSNPPCAYEWSVGNQTFVPRCLKLPYWAPSLVPNFTETRQTWFKEKFRARGQSQQDMFVLKIFSDKENGYFIDLAANHWLVLSNTFVPEYYNQWQGICIEPLPSYQLGLLTHRKCKLFLNPVSLKSGEIVKFHSAEAFSGIISDVDGPESVKDSSATTTTADSSDTQKQSLAADEHSSTSVSKGEVSTTTTTASVETGKAATTAASEEKEEFDNKGNFNVNYDLHLTTATLNDILDFAKTPSIIDYMSLDIEGAEYYAMKGLNFSKYTILLLSVERPKAKLHWLLVKHGFVFLYMSSAWGDCYYLHHTIPNFVSLMKEHHQLGPYVWENSAARHYLEYPKWTGSYIPFDEVVSTIPKHILNGK
jgi:hypothetical protein